jgi:hypothetical protein
MHSLAVVPHCEVIHDILLCYISRPIIAPVDLILFQATKQAFCYCIIPTTSFLLIQLKIHVFSVSVEIDDSHIERLDLNVLSTGFRFSLPDSHYECIANKLRFHSTFHAPSSHFTGKKVNYDG